MQQQVYGQRINHADRFDRLVEGDNVLMRLTSGALVNAVVRTFTLDRFHRLIPLVQTTNTAHKMVIPMPEDQFVSKQL